VADEVEGDDEPGEEEREHAPGGRVAAAVPFGMSVHEQRQQRVQRNRDEERGRARRRDISFHDQPSLAARPRPNRYSLSSVGGSRTTIRRSSGNTRSTVQLQPV
jgi:hypothetical protein